MSGIMDTRLSHAELTAQAAEKRFSDQVGNAVASIASASAALSDYRAASEQLLLLDFVRARTQGVETRLWVAHGRLNSRFRSDLGKLRKEQPQKPVETRKFIKQYLEFLKSSQRFYREYISTLNARFGGLPELEQIAQNIMKNNAAKKGSAPTSLSPPIQRELLLSVHQTLIYLGDLSRYRATERLDKEPDWGPALGYYGLAGSLRPSSGLSYNQQSVIALEQGDHLRVLYYVYRAMVVDEPHPNAKANLELAIKKVLRAWEKGDLSFRNLPQNKIAAKTKVLSIWFLRLHSNCYKGQAFPAYEEMEREVLAHLSTQFKETSQWHTLMRMFLVNFAAQHFAVEQFQRDPEQSQYKQAFFYFLRLNIKTFTILLSLYEENLQSVGGAALPSESAKPLPEKVTPTAHRLLLGLRLYSSWMVTNAHILSADLGDKSIQENISAMWTQYSSVLSLLASAFPVQELPEVGYQLEEDVDTFAFKPLMSEHTQKTWIVPGSATPKPRFSDAGLERFSTELEMLARIRGLLIDGLLLAIDETTPIEFSAGTFSYKYGSAMAVDPPAPVPVPAPASVPAPAPTPRPTRQEVTPGPPQQNASPINLPVQGESHRTPDISHAKKPAQAPNMDARLTQMVDDLVGPEEDDDLPTTPPMAYYVDPTVADGEDDMSNSLGSLNASIDGRKASTSRTMARQSPVRRPSAAGWAQQGNRSRTPLQPIQSSTDPWLGGLPPQSSPSLPHPNQRNSPSSAVRRGSSAQAHTRVNSAHAIPMLPLDTTQQGFSSIDPTPQGPATFGPSLTTRAPYGSFSGSFGQGGALQHQTGMHSPLLFGAGGGPWSSSAFTRRGSNYTPPNGQGG